MPADHQAAAANRASGEADTASDTGGDPEPGYSPAELEAGLDVLDAPPAPRRPRAGRVLRAALPPVAATLTFLALWQIVVWTGIKPSYSLPGPGQVWQAFVQQVSDGSAQAAVANSVRRGVAGFVASVAAGTVLGLVLSQWRFARRGLGPLLSGLQSLPSVAWVPAAIIWFGLTDAAIYAVVLLGAVPSVANGLLAGIDHIPPGYTRVSRVLGASRLAAIGHVVLPAALPAYLAGLRQGWAFAWRSLMAAELIAYSPQLGPGLGQLLDMGRELSDMPLVLASILLILLVGIVVEVGVFRPIERRVLRNRGLAAS